MPSYVLQEPCLFHVEPSEIEYVILRADRFEFDNVTEERLSDGTKLNEVFHLAIVQLDVSLNDCYSNDFPADVSF